jgi:hypothetical protein
METWDLGKYVIEYWEDTHEYLVNGVLLPSITTILKKKFGNKYNNVSPEILRKASEKGTNMHQTIQDYEEEGIDDLGSVELQNYKFLKKHYGWRVIYSEIPVVLSINEEPIAVGRLDQIIEIDGEVGVNDLKRTATFDKEYVAYQTNLYKIAYEQTYGGKLSFVSGTHLRDDKRKFYKLPVDEEKALELVKEYLEGKND